jgi:hypothetical protein
MVLGHLKGVVVSLASGQRLDEARKSLRRGGMRGTEALRQRMFLRQRVHCDDQRRTGQPGVLDN